MISLVLCAIAYLVTWYASRRSIVAGLSALLAIGYVYGIVRANIPQSFSHFIFDAAVAGFYVVHLPRLWSPAQPYEVRRIRAWMLLLLGWPLLLALVPVQDPLIQIVGLRGNTFLVPFVLVGASLEPSELRRLAKVFAILNVAAFGVGVAEFTFGIEPFFPRNTVTELIYRSHDIAGYSAHRIPSTFSSAHAYGGTIVATLPFILGVWGDAKGRTRERILLAAAVVATSIGIFMTGARLPAVILFALALLVTVHGRMGVKTRIGWLVAMTAVAFAVMTNERLQRFRTLEDTSAVAERVQGSVNRSFLELAAQYPLGNGLGGGGTSVPYFLQDRIRDPVNMENEYARIMLEQGIAGLCIWVAFIGWMLLASLKRRPTELLIGHRLARAMLVLSFGAAMIGTGTLTSIPGTVVVLMCCGWSCGRTVRRQEATARARVGEPEPQYG